MNKVQTKGITVTLDSFSDYCDAQDILVMWTVECHLDNRKIYLQDVPEDTVRESLSIAGIEKYDLTVQS